MKKKRRKHFFIKISHRNVLKRQVLKGFIVTTSWLLVEIRLFISRDDMPNAHIRNCYCMSERDSECRVFLFIFLKPRVVPVFIRLFLWFGIDLATIQLGDIFVTFTTSRWSKLCFDKVLCVVNVNDKSPDSLKVSI